MIMMLICAHFCVYFTWWPLLWWSLLIVPFEHFVPVNSEKWRHFIAMIVQKCDIWTCLCVAIFSYLLQPFHKTLPTISGGCLCWVIQATIWQIFLHQNICQKTAESSNVICTICDCVACSRTCFMGAIYFRCFRCFVVPYMAWCEYFCCKIASYIDNIPFSRWVTIQWHVHIIFIDLL